MATLPETGRVTTAEVLDCLNHYRLRATYQAVGNVIGHHWRNVKLELPEAKPRTSWIVLKSGPRRGLPSECPFHDNPLLLHPDLDRNHHIIEDHHELLALIAAYRVRPLTEGTP